MVEVVKRLPVLEELHLYRISICEQVIEAAGQSCPQLKSFKWHSLKKNRCIFRNEEAEAVAKTMPGLRHLQLVANPMDKEGLQAILDSCPHLESLDIRQCSSLKPDTLRSLSQARKDLKLTHDPLKDDDAGQQPPRVIY